MLNWDKNDQVDTAVLDFAKAFDTVPHRKLLDPGTQQATTSRHHWRHPHMDHQFPVAQEPVFTHGWGIITICQH